MTGRGKNLTKIKELLNNPTKPKQELLMGGVNMIPRNRTMSMQSIPLDSVIPEPEVQKTTEDIDAENFLGSLVGQGFAMLGAGVAGRDPGRVADQFADMRLFSDRQKESQKQREEAIKQSQELMNPNSEISKRQRTLYSRFLGEIPSDVSASDLKDPVVLRGLQEQQIKLQAPKGGGVRQPAQPKEEKKKKLGTEEAKNLFNISMSYNAIQDLKDAVNKNINKISFYGDNEYTESARRFKEGIGRLQSGGAIGGDEEKEFLNLIPTFRDNDEITKRKLEKMEQDLLFKTKLLGFTKNDILYNNEDQLNLGVLPEMTAEDKAMIEEAKKNPNDPDNAEILRTWGIK